MSWMTSSEAGADGVVGAPAGSSPLDMRGLLLGLEELGQVMAPPLHPDESHAEVGDSTLHRVEHRLVTELDGEGLRAAAVGHLCPGGAQPRDDLGGLVGDLHENGTAE